MIGPRKRFGLRNEPAPTHAARALALVALAILVPAAHADPAYQTPIGPRAIGMGSAFTAIADDASALFWNPAGIARVGHQEVAGSTANLFNTGARDNVVSFVLPMSPGLGTAVDWYHSGFDDDALGLSENRVTLGASAKIRPWLWAGVGGKLLTQSTSEDGLSVSSSRGFGLDVGVITQPIGSLRVGLVGQDLTGTSIRSDDGVTTTPYESNFRLGTAWSYQNWGTAAFDVDDRWHLGLELTPHEMVSLRGGVEQDWDGRESSTWSMGLGVKYGALRADWARSMHPTMAATDHFALAVEFNFNPAQVRIEKVEAKEVYTSLYKSYARDGFGSVQLRNLQDRPLTTRVGVYIPQLMSAPSEQEVTLRPGAVSEIPLTAVFDEKVLAQRGDQPVQVEVTASYQSKRLVRREKGAGRTVAYAPGAIDWSSGMAQAAAFVTPRDPAVDELARQASRAVLAMDGNPFGNRNLAFTAAMTDALADLGVTYIPDPTNPFTTVSETPHAVDTIHYPYQTLDRLSGDCDDTTVLIASMLGNVGVNTRFVDVPGHILLLVHTGLHERNKSALGADSTMIVIADEQVWIPLETTSLAKGFAQAWRDGAQGIGGGRGAADFVDVSDSQMRYEPVLPPCERRIRTLNEAKFNARLAATAREVTGMRDAYFAAHYGATAGELEASAEALQEIARIEFEGGGYAGARTQLEQALAKAPQSAATHNNLGVVLAAMDSLRAADEHWSAALALGRGDPGIRLNRGLARWAAGDSAAALPLVGAAVAEAGGYASACRLIGLAPEDSLDRVAGVASEDLTTRSQIRTLLRLSTSAGREAARSAAPPVLEKSPTLSPGRRIGKYMYWIE
jgi:tetratricopeptide (TPR) repeat protein